MEKRFVFTKPDNFKKFNKSFSKVAISLNYGGQIKLIEPWYLGMNSLLP